MAKPFIVTNDSISHGGVVVEGSPFSDINGKRIARVGDKVSCRTCGDTVIATGDATCVIDGRSAARHGDTTACGATLIASQFDSTLG